MSMISKLVDDLKRYAETYAMNEEQIFRNPHLGVLLNQAADTIEELSAKLETANMERSSAYYGGEWIACSERLPIGDRYQTRIDGQNYYKHLLTSTNETDVPICIGWYDQENETWYDIEGFAFNPVAWCELPEPFKG